MNKKSRKSSTINAVRWTSYAVAGAATAVAATNDSEGAILYSGVLNTAVTPAAGIHYAYINTLIANSNQGTRVLGYLTHQYNQYPPGFSGHQQGGFFAKAAMNGTHGGIHGQLRGTHVGTVLYASKLALGANISAGPFNGPKNPFSTNQMGSFRGTVLGGHPPGPGSVVGNRQWATNGTGFLGFEFNTGAGLQYGWARVTTSGGYKHEVTLVDYAYGTPGQAITAGQTMTPEPASLSSAASGALGLLTAPRVASGESRSD